MSRGQQLRLISRELLRSSRLRGRLESSVSSTFLPMKSTATCSQVRSPRKTRHCNQAARTRLRKQARICSFAPTFVLGFPGLITRASNNYGPYQFPEKFLPLLITNALEDRPLPIYGDGKQQRDWLHVEDHCRGILAVLERGRIGEVYNIGGFDIEENLTMARRVLRVTGKPETLLTFVKDRPGHDRRYALDCTKMAKDLGGNLKFLLTKASAGPSNGIRTMNLGCGIFAPVIIAPIMKSTTIIGIHRSRRSVDLNRNLLGDLYPGIPRIQEDLTPVPEATVTYRLQQ